MFLSDSKVKQYAPIIKIPLYYRIIHNKPPYRFPRQRNYKCRDIVTFVYPLMTHFNSLVVCNINSSTILTKDLIILI